MRLIHNWALSPLWLNHFIPSGAISLLFSRSILGTYWPGKFISQCPIFLPFHSVHGVLKARMLTWFAIPFSSGLRFVELSTMTCLSSLALQSMAHSVIELGKAVIHVWLFFCDCGVHSPCPLMNEDKRLMEASWWGTNCGENWILFWWVGPCLLNL